jgi:hypothetical protein
VDHDTLRSRAIEFYGYALLPGEPYDIHSIVAVANGEGDVKVPPGDPQYRYYRYSVDEWAHWDHDAFAAANAQLVEAKERFASMHSKDADDCNMDEFEVAHSDALLDAVVRGLGVAQAGGAFGAEQPFLVVWISGSAHPIMAESARRLNSAPVVTEFLREVG